MVVFDKLAPEPPLFVSRYSLYPVPGTAARKKLTGLAIMGCPALVTGAVSESTWKASDSRVGPSRWWIWAVRIR